MVRGGSRRKERERETLGLGLLGLLGLLSGEAGDEKSLLLL